MNERSLVRIVLVFASFGLLVLFFLTRQIQITETSVNKMAGMEDKDIRIEGRVVSASQGDRFSEVVIERTEEYKVRAFGRIDVMQGDVILVAGRLDEGVIIADEVILSNQT